MNWIKGDKISEVQIWWKHIVPDVRKDVRMHTWMQSSKPVQAGIMVAANYAKNSGCWPIIVPIRQTRRVITCQVLKINTVLPGLHVPCKYRGPRGYFHMSATILLPWVLEAFYARFLVSASSETQGHESVVLGKKARRKCFKTFVAPFLLTRLTAPGSPTPRMPFRLLREKREPLVPSAWVQ